MSVHLWVRAECRQNEERVGVTPEGVAELIAAGTRVSVEKSRHRAIPIDGYQAAGAVIVPEGSWPSAPEDAIVFGLKELPEDGTPLIHRHVMFGHAFKGQADAPEFLARFRAGCGALYDLEYLTEENGRRVAAFGYWAGYAGAAVGLMVWAAQQARGEPGPSQVGAYSGRDALIGELAMLIEATGRPAPSAIIIGANGRVGTGAGDLLAAMGVKVTRWDMAETASGGPFPEILEHNLFVNCVLAMPGIPVFVPKSALTSPRRLTVVADVSCDPSSDYNPVPIYSRATSFADPVIRVANAPPLDVMAIDNLPSMLPVESSRDFADQLLPHLKTLDQIDKGVWGRAGTVFDTHLAKLT